jgi:hypothetical protein
MPNRKPKERNEDILTFLNELWLKHNHKLFKTSEIRNTLKELRLNGGIVTHLVDLGFLQMARKGVCSIKFKPNKELVSKINVEEKKARENHYLKTKERKEKQSTDVEKIKIPFSILNYLQPKMCMPNWKEVDTKEINEENAIMLLKKLGYKILKPIEPLYKEI